MCLKLYLFYEVTEVFAGGENNTNQLKELNLYLKKKKAFKVSFASQVIITGDVADILVLVSKVLESSAFV